MKLAREGASDVEIRAELGISDDLWYRWKKEEKEFSQTIKKANALCKAWWMKKGRKNLENRHFSPVLWYMNMKNRFGWKDKSETDIMSGGKKLPTPIIDLTIKNNDILRGNSNSQNKEINSKKR